MRDYAELVKGLRCCSKIDARNNGCDSCPYEYCGDDCQNLCGCAADAIEELLAAVPHWISVVERLPEKHKSVLFYIPWNKTNMIGWIDEGGGINLEGYGKCYDFSLIKPSYWMPLPKAPEEVE